MDSIVSKVSYLSGLVDGLKIDRNTNEGKVIIEIVNVLKSMAEEIDDISEAQKNMIEYVDSINEDLADLQDNLYDDDYEAYKDEGENFAGIQCPNCNDIVYVDKDILEQKRELTCPNCHNNIYFQDNNIKDEKSSDS
ncbi:CD1247 N-terminal domain-containing protein [Clostridium sp. WILCCON 0269]|uniref:CD1247 N-terminal domain-containing protein n=1 Tax=Candidatus Clostridium eludens TaxID=3381663 RepID=A0ABW8SLF2_9CLOT